MLSIFLIFLVEIIAFRWGTAKLAALGISHGTSSFTLDTCSEILITESIDPHGHGIGGHAAHGPESQAPRNEKEKDIETGSGTDDHASRHAMGTAAHHSHGTGIADNAWTQIIGVAILEFGVVLHRCAPKSHSQLS